MTLSAPILPLKKWKFSSDILKGEHAIFSQLPMAKEITGTPTHKKLTEKIKIKFLTIHLIFKYIENLPKAADSLPKTKYSG